MYGQERPLGFLVTGGEASDYKSAAGLLDIPVGKPRLMLADKGYDGDAFRTELLQKGVLPVIPARANRKNPAKHDRIAYRDRNRIERTFNRLKQARRIATRYDKTRLSFLAFLNLAAARLCVKDYVNRT
ncbi:truncated transposase [Fulvimarina pelagi HTCC2506]|uniref:Truncated transposase n=1 Tax=Fulvimarina pelagi HTCC2506 TaxID=314231 RepID=Q0FYM7_9HYPH|nr:truncated transposase [Fulvimarina pelagi HTCC2506]